MNTLFQDEFNMLSEQALATNVAKGFWDSRQGGQHDHTFIGLVHTEVSEAMEAMRHGNPPDDKIPEFSGVEAELADVIIRIMGHSAGRGWNVAGAIEAKLAYNAGREYRHGGKEF
jgi:NTP pyrophosphatase (non-canonical NTP hydrolase)